ncbi:hypothetical protein B0H13DRAFT_2333053 [Mycena leptocephala]|nr:hypothetical protein B0H13DRAFT_2333053 [Mycena leptocephala]
MQSADAYFLLGTGSSRDIARKHNSTMAPVSLAWLMVQAKDGVTAPILRVGTTSLEKLGALEVDIKYMEEQ